MKSIKKTKFISPHIMKHILSTALIAMMLTLALADWAAPRIQAHYDYPDISFPHGTSAAYAVLAYPL